MSLPTGKNVIGLDVGGTKIQCGLVSPTGKILAHVTLPTEVAKGRAAIMHNIMMAIEAVWKKNTAAIGIGLAGLIDHRLGVYRQGPNFPKSFRNIPFALLLGKKYGVPVRLDNDVHCFSLAEAVYGAGRNHRNVVGITLGTGIGGGIVINGTLYRGKDNAAGEVGHMIIDLSSDAPCGCKNKGHFEALASGSAMARLYKLRTGIDRTPLEVENEAKNGGKHALAVLTEMQHGLAAGLANIMQILNPDVIVIGGGLRRVKMLWQPAIKEAQKLVIYPELKKTVIAKSILGSDAGVLGASLLTREAPM